MNDAKWFLSGYKRCRRHVEDMLEEVAIINAQATKVTQVLKDDGGSGCKSTDGLERTICRLIDKKDELQKRIQEMLDRADTIEQTIKQVPDEMQRDVLYKRYILCKSYEYIADSLDISLRYVYNLHGFGLIAVQKTIDKAD